MKKIIVILSILCLAGCAFNVNAKAINQNPNCSKTNCSNYQNSCSANSSCSSKHEYHHNHGGNNENYSNGKGNENCPNK